MTTRFSRLARHKRAVGILAATAAVAAMSATGVSGAVASDRVAYTNSVPSWATRANDAGAASAPTTVEGEVYLALKDQQGAEQLASAVSDPASPQYRRPISPAAWIARFAPTQSSFAETLAYLKSQGVTITATPASREYVIFRGTAAQVNGIFGTQLHSYRYDNRVLLAPSSTPSLPTSIAAAVSGVSLDQSSALTRPDSVTQGQLSSTPSATRQALVATPSATPTAPLVNTPCSTYIGQHYATVPTAYGHTAFPTYNCGYTPTQLRSAYGLTALHSRGVTGNGQTVAIIDSYASPSIVQNVNSYAAQVGEPTLRPGQYSQIVPTPSQFQDEALCQYPSGWQGEQTLDVEGVHAIAPGANILYVGGFDCEGGLDYALSTVLDRGLANIVSNSYGDTGEALPLSTINGENNLYIQAAGEGIGLYFSSGDSGDESPNGLSPQPDFPASSPWVTAVGGTSVAINQAGSISYQTGWGDALDKIVKTSTGSLAYSTPLPGDLFGGGAGGGPSLFFPEPSYQKGIVPASLAKGERTVPDLSSLADPYTGMQIGITPITDDATLATGPYENDTYGGTSVASPLMAAQMAIVQQITGVRLGFANPTVYALYRVAPGVFTDVTPLTSNGERALAYTSKHSGNSYLVSLQNDTSLTTTKGYDDTTGLGSPSFQVLTLLAQGRH